VGQPSYGRPRGDEHREPGADVVSGGGGEHSGSSSIPDPEPEPTAVTVQVTYLRRRPLAPVVKPYVVGASSRKTIYVTGRGRAGGDECRRRSIDGPGVAGDCRAGDVI